MNGGLMVKEWETNGINYMFYTRRRPGRAFKDT
jgi:hypothetical protein